MEDRDASPSIAGDDGVSLDGRETVEGVSAQQSEAGAPPDGDRQTTDGGSGEPFVSADNANDAVGSGDAGAGPSEQPATAFQDNATLQAEPIGPIDDDQAIVQGRWWEAPQLLRKMKALP